MFVLLMVGHLQPKDYVAFSSLLFTPSVLLIRQLFRKLLGITDTQTWLPSSFPYKTKKSGQVPRHDGNTPPRRLDEDEWLASSSGLLTLSPPIR
jgi:hypothetical protein